MSRSSSSASRVDAVDFHKRECEIGGRAVTSNVSAGKSVDVSGLGTIEITVNAGTSANVIGEGPSVQIDLTAGKSATVQAVGNLDRRNYRRRNPRLSPGSKM